MIKLCFKATPPIIKQEKIDYKLLIAYYLHKYNHILRPVNRKNGKTINKNVCCPKCGASHDYIYDNNGSNGQYQCKVCGQTFPGDTIKFVADGYSAYPLAKQQLELRDNLLLDLIQVIGLTNDDDVSTEHRWIKQVVERLNRTFKASYRVTCGYCGEDGVLFGAHSGLPIITYCALTHVTTGVHLMNLKNLMLHVIC